MHAQYQVVLAAGALPAGAWPRLLAEVHRAVPAVGTLPGPRLLRVAVPVPDDVQSQALTAVAALAAVTAAVAAAGLAGRVAYRGADLLTRAADGTVALVLVTHPALAGVQRLEPATVPSGELEVAGVGWMDLELIARLDAVVSMDLFARAAGLPAADHLLAAGIGAYGTGPWISRFGVWAARMVGEAVRAGVVLDADVLCGEAERCCAPGEWQLLGPALAAGLLGAGMGEVFEDGERVHLPLVLAGLRAMSMAALALTAAIQDREPLEVLTGVCRLR